MKKNNPFEDETVDVDEKPSVSYEGVKYSIEEAEALARWLNDDVPVALFNRLLDNVRQESVDLMDAGFVTMGNAEELVRQSAMRKMISSIKTMGGDLTLQLEAIAHANDV